MGQEGKAFPVCAGSRVSFPKGMLGGGGRWEGYSSFSSTWDKCSKGRFANLSRFLCCTAVSVTSQAMDYTDAKAFQLLLFVQNRARKN